MKKLIVLCILFTLLLSLVLTACTPTSGDTSVQSEDSSFEESSEHPIVESSDITDETSEMSDETSITEDSSIPQENSEQDESSRPETLYFDNANVADAVRNAVTHDYCTCGTQYYDLYATVPYDPKYDPEYRFDDFLIEYGYAKNDDEIYACFEEFMIEYTASRNEGHCTWMPDLYHYVKYFSVTKEDYLKFREQQLEFYYEHGYGHYEILTNREIEIIFGNYDEETIMKELKSASTLYFDGHLYTVHNLFSEKDTSDELIKKMLKTDEFQLYLFDIKELYPKDQDGYFYAEQLFDRINALKAEMENE